MQLSFLIIIFVIEIFQPALPFNVDTYCPIVYENPVVSDSARSSYFGYSVGIAPGNKPIIVIGAPRSNSSFVSEFYEPGAVFSCPLMEKCEMLKLKPPLPNRDTTAHFNLTSAWTGGSIDIEDKKDGILAMCSPHIKYMIHNNGVLEQYLPGACYWMESSEYYLSTPFTDKRNKFTETSGSYTFFNLGVAQYGMSIHLPKYRKPEKKKMLGGAPGVYNWKGSVVLNEDGSDFGNSNNKRKRSADIHTLAKTITLEPQKYNDMIKYFDYFGYQVSSGRFFNAELLYVSSSPRGASQLKGSAKCTGSVTIFKYNNPQNPPKKMFEEVTRLYGVQIGEYFGASIAVLDIDGDKKDDLVVGSPHFFDNNGNEGKVYIFKGTDSARMNLDDSLYGSGQFGLAVASLGDINRDNYEDFAVSAPYKGNGEIYIYNGGEDSVKKTQTITPEVLGLPLKGFGISFSRPIDLDDNMFPDFAVGSYLSGHTVVLRSYPVVSFTSDFYFDKTEINVREPGKIVLKVFINSHYSGYKSVENLLVERKIEVDPIYKRFKINHMEHVSLSMFTHNLTVNYDKNSTQVHDSAYGLLLADNEFDTDSDVPVTVSHKILNDFGKGKIIISNSSDSGEDKFCKMCVVFDINKQNINLTRHFKFIQKCGSNICQPDLKVKCDIATRRFVIGSEEDLAFDVNIINLEKDIAYQVSITIEFESVLQEKVLNRKCSSSSVNGTQIKCTLGTFLHKKSDNISISFDAKRLQRLLGRPFLPALNFSVTAHTSGTDKNEANNYCSYSLELDAVASLRVFGNSKPDQKYFMKGDITSNNISVSHIYQINQEGPTPVLDVARPNVEFYIPENISRGDEVFNFLTDIEYKASDSKDFLLCQYNSQIIDNENTKENIVHFKENQLNMMDETDSKGKIYMSHEDITMYINCSTHNVQCLKISCPFAEFQMNITMTFNITALEQFIGKKNVILIASKAISSIDNKNYRPFLNDTKLGEAIVATPFISTFPSSPVQWWIILLAIILGILLLALIMYALVKFGFFQRKKKEQLESLKNNDSLDVKPLDDIEVVEENLMYS